LSQNLARSFNDESLIAWFNPLQLTCVAHCPVMFRDKIVTKYGKTSVISLSTRQCAYWRQLKWSLLNTLLNIHR